VTTPAPERPTIGTSRVPVPPSGHRDANWYRRAATKTSAAQPDAQLTSGVTDDDAWAVVSHIAAGIILYGGLGWLLGTLLGQRPLFIAGGVLLGVSLALFMLFRRLESKRHGPETLREDRP
jgi:F0F1-type ATP synthase assembly protein I